MTAVGHCVGSLFLLLTLVVFTSAHTVSVIAPNTFRLGAEETVGVISESRNPQEIKLYFQDLPRRQHNFSETIVKVGKDAPQIARMRVDPDQIPDLALSNEKTKHYVLLVAEGRNFRKEVQVIVGLQSGYMFIQTDKPIYTPKQTVHVRIISLNQSMVSENQNFTVQIRNPQNVIVDDTKSSSLHTNHGLYNYFFEFPPNALEGEWSVVVKYGHKIPRNETVLFELKQYVRPTYEVKLKSPEVILPVDNVIKVDVEAKYVYGRNVQGTVICKFGVMSETKKTIYVGKAVQQVLNSGRATCSINRTTFEEHRDVGWFDTISGSRLVVEAVVTERATGEKDSASSSHTLFSKTKYLVDFKRSLREFRPGYTAAIQAVIKEATGQKAPNVRARVEVKNERGEVIEPEDDQWEDTTNEDGRVLFLIPTEQDIQKLYISVTTVNPELSPELQGVKNHEMTAVTSNSFVSLDRTNMFNSLKVGDFFTSNVYCNPSNMPVSFVATANGRVVKLSSLAVVRGKQRTVHIKVTDQMMPSFRITLLAVHRDQTLTDSVKVDVQDECRVKAKITLQTTLTNAEPGKAGSITVNGSPGTVVGLLGVDKAVYVLRNKGLLTKDKMFSKMEEHDLGCGPGGGRDTQSVLANAGLIFLSDTSTDAPERSSCTERRLNKRSIRDEVLSQEDETLRECCELGTYEGQLNRTCEERAEIIERYHKDDDCASVFQRCCNRTAHMNDQMKLQGIHDLDYLEDPKIPDREDSKRERTDFRETIVVDTGVIGGDKRWVVPLTLPHSITTWVIQAVGINPRHGMCVADPIEAVAFQEVFIQLKLPYSVVRNEQIELRATIFNYGRNRTKVSVYMHGVKGLCSEAEPNERGTVKLVVLSGNGSAETVAFPVVPLEIGMIPIKIVAISPNAEDSILQKLNVVAEGIPHEENILIEVDPANLDKRKQRNIVSEKFQTQVQEDRMRQTSTVRLRPDQDYIPGTDSCVITAIGEKFGPAVQTVLNNPDQLIKLPTGCGEQAMAKMAPTLYTLHYLKVTKKLTAEQEANGYQFIRAGYSRVLNYRKPDGSYAAFTSRPSSTWLTAFVAKVFCQAKKYVFIDENTICSALDWLAKNQNPDGSFVDKNPLYDRRMAGGVQADIPMTAFVLNTLYKCDCNQMDMTNVKAKAEAYLIRELPKFTGPYYLSIAAYALSLADPNVAGLDANKLLLEKATVNEGLNHRYWGQPGTAYAVETTSYALLTQLIHNNLDIAGSIVNWLNTQRTASGSFWSTQDTVIALEAMAEYAILARDDVMNLTCKLTASDNAHFIHNIDFTPENARVLRSYELSKLSGVLELEAQGTGVGLVNVQLKYNVPKKLNEICKFDINITVTDKQPHFNNLDNTMVNIVAPDAPLERNLSNSNHVVNITVCVQYLFHQDSNMAIVDVGILTGYKVEEKDLDRIVKDPALPVSRYELAGRSVVFYLDKIGHEEKTCFWFRAEREYIVSRMESSVVRVYDYYNPDQACTEFFSPNLLSAIIQKECAREVCQCAEGGCPPKEPFKKIMQEPDNLKQRKLLQGLACDKEYFVWKVEVESVKNDSSSFQTVEVKVVGVLREGRESRADLFSSPQRQFLGRSHCDSVELTPGKKYIIIGTDNEPIEQKDGVVRYLYYINKQTRIYEWNAVSNRKNPRNEWTEPMKLQNTFEWLEKQFKAKIGCIH